jgi:hypothetical protein
MKKSKKTKRKKPRTTHVIHFDLEDEELLDFPWYEDKEPPPIVKPEKGKSKKILSGYVTKLCLCSRYNIYQ